MISKEAENLLCEIIKHESEEKYWTERFEKANRREDTILRGWFKELKENQLIEILWADNIPYIITVLKDGYLYQQHKEENEQYERDMNMSKFEKNLNELLERAKNLKAPNRLKTDDRGQAQNNAVYVWLNDVKIFRSRYLKNHPLYSDMEVLLDNSDFYRVVSYLASISNDADFIDKMNGVENVEITKRQVKTLHEYDVFLSHADKDKITYVNNLYKSLSTLGVNIYYDKVSNEWGDMWKEHILDGTAKSEFAIIVISHNYFDRVWTEKELKEFLNRQNEEGQKIILPIIHNITLEQLREKYPYIADIQVLDSSKYTCNQIALLFAKQLIKRLKANID